jgi:hypothetical protein
MRCSRCGNENPADNRFCGMCGATLLAPPPAPVKVPETATQRAASGGADIPAAPVITAARPPEPPPRPVETPHPPAPVHDDPPSISGPSFLGLNDPPPRKRASLSADPHHDSSSGNLDYLLEDEEEPHHGGGGKYILILIALALAVGFGYLRWKSGGFAWLNPSPKPAATQAPNATDTNPAPSETGSSPANTPAGQNPSSTPAITPVEPAAANGNAAAPAPTNSAPASTTPPANNATPSAAAVKPSDGASTAPGNPKTATHESASDNNTDDEAAAPPKPAEKPKPAADVAHEKPAAAITPPKPVDTVAEAQRYLYGKGVPQNCDRGLRLLKPAANASNPKAMIEMGALYSAGLCTPRDLPTAYRWFALALRKDPDNQSVQTDLQKLWGEMTQPERQLAIRLTQ